MGIYTEKFREVIDKLPKTPDQFESPIHAASAMAQLTNSTLQVLGALEEALEDAQNESLRLQEMLMDKAPIWEPQKKTEG